MKQSRRQLPQQKISVLERLTDIYLAVLLSFFILHVSMGGYETIDQTKYKCFLVISGGYVLVSFILWLEMQLTGQIKGFSLKEILRRSSWAQWLLTAYLLLSLISAILSQFPETWRGMSRNEGFWTICIYIFSFLLLSVFGRFKPWMLSVLGSSITVCCIVSILQLFGCNPLGLYPDGLTYYDAGYAYTGAYLGTIGNVDILSALLALVIPLFGVALWKGTSKYRYWLLIPLGLSLVVLLWSKVAAGYVALIGGTLLAVPVLMETKRSKLIAGIGSAVLFIIGLAIVYFIDFESGTLYELHSILHGEVDLGFGSGRLLIWSQVLEIVPDHLLFGIGPDTLMGAGLDGFRRYDPAKDLLVVAPVDLAHNEYLNILISQGVFALAAYLTALVVSAIGWVKHSNRDPVIAACGCSILWYCIQIFFGFSLLFTAPLFWAVWAFMDQEIRRETVKQHTKERNRKKD